MVLPFVARQQRAHVAGRHALKLSRVALKAQGALQHEFVSADVLRHPESREPRRRSEPVLTPENVPAKTFHFRFFQGWPQPIDLQLFSTSAWRSARWSI